MDAVDSIREILEARWLLRDSKLGDLSVLAIMLGCLAAGWALTRPAVSLKAAGRLLTVSSAALLSALLVCGLVNCHRLVGICRENHVIEWLSAGLLLAGWGIALALVVRRARSDQASPLAALLMAGLFWGFWRELEWGRPFMGEKLIFTRNFFRLGAYLSPEHFEALSRRTHVDPVLLFGLHWVSAIVALVLVAALLSYSWEHRHTLKGELKGSSGEGSGLYFLLGVGIFIGSQVVGTLIRRLLQPGLLMEYYRTYGLTHRVLDEPLEAIGAACFLMSVACLWKETPTRRRATSANLAASSSEGSPEFGR